MDPAAEIGARIAEIRSRIAPPAPPGFEAILQARLGDAAASPPAGALPTTEGSSAAPWLGATVTLGAMLAGGVRPAVPSVLPATPGKVLAPDLQAYLEATGVRDRNGRLRADELVEVSGAWRGTAKLLPPAAEAWERMRAAAAADGIDLRLIGAYRTYESQARAHAAYLAGEKSARVLPPGTSEHGVGLAIDVTNGHTVGPGDPEWAWLQANARDYGWYPIDSESWHWEYRGLPG
ncbi:MAG TPA: hypothetical protein ENK55_02805 [Actinobacteria bacterium]|nr:hypothetical protein [Actinomycetota bacterium]